MTLKHILGQSEFVEGVGHIYPIKVKDYDEFNDCSNVLYISNQHFETGDDYKLLDLLIFLEDGKLIPLLEQLFSLTTREKVVFISNELNYGFIVNENYFINGNNYDLVRKIIMNQNLLFEQKVYKNPLVQEWANKVLEARSKNGIKITTEDMITTISVFCGKTYDQIAEQTIYQLQADFKRINKLKEYDTSVDFACVAGDKVSINHFAEWVNMFENPYEDLFVSKDKISNLNKAIGG